PPAPPTPDLPASVSSRRLQPEVMDDPQLDPDLHAHALRSLGRINRLSRTASWLWPVLRHRYHARSPAPTATRPFRVADLACGGGDLLLDLAACARAQNLHCQWIGLDLSPVALGYARRQAEHKNLPVTFQPHDALRDPLPDATDLVYSSLFLHHLEASQALDVLRKLREGADTVVIDDLRRGRLAYAATVLGTRLITRSPVVHVDGPLSVRAAWTLDELRALAQQAGLDQPDLRPRFPWRMQLIWDRGPGKDQP
ncbi:MAG: methyltransferase domain-containing protein, partial [Planctomycetota bacterium]